MNRNAGLDVLRAVAIFMVLGQHAAWGDGLIGALWTHGGWAGVDLFFVLSGFLVSGLLFNDNRWGRFLIRRGWKIYPPFWAFLAVTLMVYDCPAVNVASELTFTQNYFPPIWLHTWSLAVEEHFYLMLPAVLLVTRRWDHKPLPWLVVAVVGACTLGRALSGFNPFDEHTGHWTHLRIDSLFVGMLARYWWLGHKDQCAAQAGRLALYGGVVAASPFLVNMGTWYGVVILAAGNAALVLGVVSLDVRGTAADALAFIGRHSYSIYLWHTAVGLWLAQPLGWAFPGYAAASLLVGIIMAWLVEVPTLALRDRFAR